MAFLQIWQTEIHSPTLKHISLLVKLEYNSPQSLTPSTRFMTSSVWPIIDLFQSSFAFMFFGHEDSLSYGQVIKGFMKSHSRADDNDTVSICWWSASKPKLHKMVTLMDHFVSKQIYQCFSMVRPGMCCIFTRRSLKGPVYRI